MLKVICLIFFINTRKYFSLLTITTRWTQQSYINLSAFTPDIESDVKIS